MLLHPFVNVFIPGHVRKDFYMYRTCMFLKREWPEMEEETNLAVKEKYLRNFHKFLQIP